MLNEIKNTSEKEYDDQEVIDYIRRINPDSEGIASLDDDDITYLIDLIYEYMEKAGFIDEEEPVDKDEMFDVDIDEIYSYVIKEISRDKMEIKISKEDFTLLYDAEVEYSESLLDEADE